MSSPSESNPQPRIVCRENTSRAASRLQALNPQVVSLTRTPRIRLDSHANAFPPTPPVVGREETLPPPPPLAPRTTPPVSPAGPPSTPINSHAYACPRR